MRNGLIKAGQYVLEAAGVALSVWGLRMAWEPAAWIALGAYVILLASNLTPLTYGQGDEK